MALVALRTGLDGFFALPPQAGAETRPARAGDPQVRWLLPVQVPGRHRLPVKLFVHAMPPAGGLSLNATTAGAVRLVQLRPDAGGCFRPPQGSWKSGRKASGQLSRYAKQMDYSLMWLGSVCNTLQEPTVTSIIDLKKTTVCGESGFPSEFLGVSATQSVAPEHIAELLGIEVRAGDELLPRERFQELEDIQPDSFSACTLRPSPDRVVVVHNPLSPKTRQKSDVAHELAHTLLDHDLSRVQRLGDVTFLSCDLIQEEEAAWLSGCLLLPRALLLAEVRSGATARDIEGGRHSFQGGLR